MKQPAFSIPDDSLQAKLQPVIDWITHFSQQIRSSRSLQLALVCFLFGVISSGYGMHSLFADSHLVCRDGDSIAQASQSNGESVDFFELEVAAQLDSAKLEAESKLVSSTQVGDDNNTLNQGESSLITIDVSGAVRQPGVYTVNNSARLGDVIAAAGGLTTQANAQEVAQVLNLASKLSDGQKVYIPFSGEDLQSIVQRQFLDQSQGAVSSKVAIQSDANVKPQSELDTSTDRTSESGLTAEISINTATAQELMELKGIGEKRAADIISGRPYDAVTDLLEREVLTKALFESLQDFLKL